MRKMKWVAGWTAIIWVLTWQGFAGMALVCAFAALIHGTAMALASLRRDRECLVCGRPYAIGRLGMHEACARETRVVR
jgi:hypothetical protein